MSHGLPLSGKISPVSTGMTHTIPSVFFWISQPCIAFSASAGRIIPQRTARGGNMFPKMPILDGSSEASIRDWDTDMQVFQEELDEAISHVLDRETTLDGLAAALKAGLTPYNDGDWDPVEVFVKDNAVSIENGGVVTVATLSGAGINGGSSQRTLWTTASPPPRRSSMSRSLGLRPVIFGGAPTKIWSPWRSLRTTG